MINPQNPLEQCCFLPTKNRLNLAKDKMMNKFFRAKKLKQSKISLKSYCSDKKNLRFDLKRLEIKQPDSPAKTIIQKLYTTESGLEIKQTKQKFRINVFSPQNITTKNNTQQKQPYQQNYFLFQSQSPNKINFTYFAFNQSFNEGCNLDRLLQNDEKLEENKTCLAKEKNYSSGSQSINQRLYAITKDDDMRIKKLQEEDLRSTMDLFRQLSRCSIKKAKSIISVQDVEERQEFMKESIVIQKHSESKNSLKYL